MGFANYKQNDRKRLERLGFVPNNTPLLSCPLLIKFCSWLISAGLNVRLGKRFLARSSIGSDSVNYAGTWLMMATPLGWTILGLYKIGWTRADGLEPSCALISLFI